MKTLLTRFVVGAGAMLLAATVFAQGYPNRPIKLIVGFAAGGAGDLSGRLMAEVMSAQLGQPVVVENRAGATGQLGHDAVKASAPDGYTIGVLALPTVVATLVSGKPISATEITPVAMHYDAPFPVIINPAAPHMSGVTTMRELVAAVKANPGKINYTSAGTASTGHLFGTWLALEEGMNWQHIGYKGLAPAATDLMAGRLAAIMGNPPNDVQLIKEGKLRVLSTSGAVRMSRYEGAPSLIEAGYGRFAVSSWGGFLGPAGVTNDIVGRLAAAIRAFFDRKDLVEKLALQVPDPAFQPATVLSERLRGDIEKFSKVIREAGIKPE